MLITILGSTKVCTLEQFQRVPLLKAGLRWARFTGYKHMFSCCHVRHQHWCGILDGLGLVLCLYTCLELS